jgi:hypothetical protein
MVASDWMAMDITIKMGLSAKNNDANIAARSFNKNLLSLKNTSIVANPKKKEINLPVGSQKPKIL